jgi:aspartyl-tRNA(Asn)/glutamyl-tRNA(Gln) amidotransferase subunit A
VTADLLDLTALELAGLIERRSVSPVEVMRMVLDRLDETEPFLNAFISRCDEQALAEAEAAEAQIAAGNYRGPLHGMPIAIKDNIAVAGTITTAGAKFLKENLTTEDAEAVARLRAAGAIVVGKTNMFELAVGSRSINPHYGDARNPWGPNHDAGGSSGGSAVAVAARQVPPALGTDAAGSVRMPASVSGIVGLKQTQGRVSARGILASQNVTVDHIGPMARTVADAALLLETIAGYDPRCATVQDRPVPPYRALARENLSGLRVGVPANYYFDLIDPEVESGVRAAIRVLEELGASTQLVHFPELEAMMNARVALGAEGLALHDPWLRDHPEEYSDELRRRLLANYFIPGRDLARANRVRRLLKETFATTFEKVDLIAAPTTPIVSFPLDATTVSVFDKRIGEQVTQSAMAMMLRLTSTGNFSGLPAITVPGGFTQAGLPIGFQLIARPFEEELLLGAAHAYEQATRWYTRIPPYITPAADVAA